MLRYEYMDRQAAKIVIERLAERFPDAKPELLYTTPFELLVAVILSAQCTDKRVNIVTRALFKKYNTPEKMLELTEAELAEKIHSCGFYNMKAKHILSTCKDIVTRFNGQVPSTLDELQTLDGVGRKTANVVYAVAFGGNAIAVDTHVFRVSNRIGLAKANNPLDTEKQLNAILDENGWSKAHHYLIFHGRNICKAQRPTCKDCPVFDLCENKP